MATLTIDNFPEDLYNRLKHQAEREHRSVAQQVIRTLDSNVDQIRNLSIMGLRGLGKELWEGIDAAEYIREERDSWES